MDGEEVRHFKRLVSLSDYRHPPAVTCHAISQYNSLVRDGRSNTGSMGGGGGEGKWKNGKEEITGVAFISDGNKMNDRQQLATFV